MTTFRTPRATPRAAGALACFLALAGLAASAYAGPENTGSTLNLAQALKRTLLVFPFDTPKTIPNRDDVQSLLTDAAVSRLATSQLYTVVQFRRGLGPIARAMTEQQLSESDVSEPFAADNAKASKITKLVGYDVAFVGSVDDYQYSDADKQVNMTISGRLIDMANGNVIKSATLSQASSKGGKATQEDRALEAARAASEKLMAQIVPFTSVTPLPPPDNKTKVKQTPSGTGKKHSKDTGWLIGLLVVGLGIGLGIAGSSSGGGGGGGGGGGSDNPPAPPR